MPELPIRAISGTSDSELKCSAEMLIGWNLSAFLSWNLSGGRWTFLASGPRMLCSWGGIVESCGEQLRCRQWDRAKATCFLVARSQPLWRESLWYISEKSCKRDCPPICYIRTDMDGSSLWRLVHFESFGSISTWPSLPLRFNGGAWIPTENVAAMPCPNVPLRPLVHDKWAHFLRFFWMTSKKQFSAQVLPGHLRILMNREAISKQPHSSSVLFLIIYHTILIQCLIFYMIGYCKMWGC